MTSSPFFLFLFKIVIFGFWKLRLTVSMNIKNSNSTSWNMGALWLYLSILQKCYRSATHCAVQWLPCKSCSGTIKQQQLQCSAVQLNHQRGRYTTTRGRWISKFVKIKSGHLYSYVKLNFRAGLFSCIFWFEAIYLGSWALLVFWSCSWENGTQRAQKMKFSKIGSKST